MLRAMVSDRLSLDGGANAWLRTETMVPNIAWPVVLGDPFVVTAEGHWNAIGENSIEEITSWVVSFWLTKRHGFRVYLEAGRQRVFTCQTRPKYPIVPSLNCFVEVDSQGDGKTRYSPARVGQYRGMKKMNGSESVVIESKKQRE